MKLTTVQRESFEHLTLDNCHWYSFLRLAWFGYLLVLLCSFYLMLGKKVEKYKLEKKNRKQNGRKSINRKIKKSKNKRSKNKKSKDQKVEKQ
jgi:hypothetical protein